MKQDSSLTALFLFCIVMAILPGCTSVIATSEPFVGAPTYPPTDPATIQIIREAPSRPYEKLGEIFIEPQSGKPPVEKIEQKLREEGAKFGADAVLITFDRLMPSGGTYFGGWGSGVIQRTYGHSVRADAIKYKK